MKFKLSIYFCYLGLSFLASLSEALQAVSLFRVLSVHHKLPLHAVNKLLLLSAAARALCGFLWGPLLDLGGPPLGCCLFFLCSLGASLLTRCSTVSFSLLAAARLFGGAATSLLETAFEAFAVHGHRQTQQQQQQQQQQETGAQHSLLGQQEKAQQQLQQQQQQGSQPQRQLDRMLAHGPGLAAE
ncbi:hypothetical protein, conserved [Eimeria tenella]|uniref:Molybdate-anion transporter n=1 Tax=Eimeria tenella TaxID=5802 RepID=U6KRW1_EIMTE|nr:hypothetical protein, conserved [Eimeria tenella]CDJ39094.1 hypothetical protein, conserved [Eimeria tenella]|eukprot:XP_013229849.1 hypothetical protein, conserved [Eimeria tenella]